MQNLIYALIQVLHNAGAATVVGTAATGLWLVREQPVRLQRLALIAAFAWALQAATGAAFGITSYYFYGQLPDIHGIALVALAVKVICAVFGFFLSVVCLKYGIQWLRPKVLRAWGTLFGLGITALSAAAFLRWYS